LPVASVPTFAVALSVAYFLHSLYMKISVSDCLVPVLFQRAPFLPTLSALSSLTNMDAPALTKTGLDRVVVFLRLLLVLFGLVASAAVTHASAVATPTFSSVAGTYTSAQSVTITSATSGASIRYTTDGSTPSPTAGTLYSSPVSIEGTTTLKAIAYETGFTNSAIKSGTYTIKTIAPIFSPVGGTYSSAQSVMIISTTSGASLAYTTDGTTPTETGGTVTNGTVYSDPVSISADTTLKAIAYETGLTDSSVISGTYSIKAIAPVFTPAAGTYTSPQMVTMTSATSGASINYTTDGSMPSATNGTVYSGPVSIGATITLKAIAYEVGLISSSVTSGTYTIKAVAPVFSPAAGTYTSVQTVTITSATSGASINYTTDGSTPSATAGTIYSGPILIGATTTLKAIAYETGLANSAVTSGTYRIKLPKVAKPVFSPAAGTFSSAQTVTITSATSGAAICYTTDASTPTETNGTIYSGPVNIGSTTTLKAIAFKSGFTDSTVTSRTYTITQPPTITSSLTATGEVGAVFSYQITASNGATSYNATGFPPGLNVDTSTGLITGTPTTAGTTNITISASNSGGVGSATFVLTVNPEPVIFTVSPVSFTYNGSAQGPVITPAVSGATYSISGTASATTAGSYSVTATATGNYTGTSGPIAWTIAQATPVVSWATPSPIVYGTALDPTELNATANVAGSFIYIPTAGTVLNVGTQTLSVAFTPTDATDYNNASASVSLTVNPPPPAAPVFSPVTGVYTSAQTVTIISATSGSSIRYTTDGSTPSETNGTLYSGPLSISRPTTINAIAYNMGSTDSQITSATIWILTVNITTPANGSTVP
jgi:hypothetical protein